MWRQLAELPRSLWILLVATVVNRLGTFVFPLLAVYLVAGEDISVARSGLLLSLGSVGLLAGSLLGGVLAGRLGCRPVLVAALLLNAAGYAGLVAVAASQPGYVGFLFVALTGMGMFSPAANTFIAAVTTEQNRSFAYATNYVGTNVGMGLGPLLGGIAAAHSFALMFWLDIVVSLLCAAAVLTIPASVAPARRSAPEPAPGSGDTRIGASRAARRDAAVLCLLSGFFVAPLIGLEYTAPLAVTTVLKESTVWVGAVYTINSIVIVTSSMLVEKRLRGRDPLAAMVLGGVLWSAGLAIVVFAFSLPALLLSVVVWTFGEIVVSITVPTFLANTVDERSVGRYMSLNAFVLSFTRLTVPFGLGYAWQQHGYESALLAVLALPMIGVVLFGVLLAGRRGAVRTAETVSADSP